MKKIAKLFAWCFLCLMIVCCTESQVNDSTDTDTNTEEENTDDDTDQDDQDDADTDTDADNDDSDDTDVDDDTSSAIIYSPSTRSTPYIPLTVYRTSKTDGTLPNTAQTNTRILKNMTEFTAGSSEDYYNSINKYGSRTDKMGTATGRYHTEKINGRWWIVDPEGYLNIQRGLNSINHSLGNENDGAWAAKWGSVSAWLGDLYPDFKDLGFNATGAFSKDSDCGYTGLMAYNNTGVENPLTVAPSMGFVSAFRSAKGVAYANGNSNTECVVALHEDWAQWCIDYIPTSSVATYEADPNVLGFFSDNELTFCSNSVDVIDKLLEIEDTDNYGRKAAEEFLTRKGITEAQLTDDYRDDFAGELADAYYGGIRAALDYHNYKILYLGSRLHGRPKQVRQIIEAAGKSCDVISINYYSRWSVEFTGTTESTVPIVTDYWEAADAPFLVSEFYMKAVDGAELSGSTVTNTDGAGWLVSTQEERGYWYQHFTLGLLESTHCVGWHWFRYQDDASANRGFYDRNYNQWTTLATYAKELNYNTYGLIDYFDLH